MADVYLASESTTLATALGTVNAADSVFLQDFAVVYTNGDISGDDLTALTLTPGFEGRFQGAGVLIAVVNQTSTGILKNQSNSGYIEFTSTSTAGVIYNVINQSSRADGQLHGNTADTQNWYNISGVGFIETNYDVNTAWCYGGQLFIRRTATAATFPLAGSLNVSGGFCELGRDVAQINVSGTGRLRLLNTDITPSGTVNMDGGTIEVIETGAWANGGVLEAGTIDLTQLKRSFTATSQTWHPGIIIRVKRTNSATMTRATPTDLAGGPTYQYID
jgi:hypothetical protein